MVALLMENNGGLGYSHFRTLPYRFEMQEICRHHGKFQPQLEAKYKHVVLSEMATCFFSLGQGFNGCHTKRSKLIAVQSKEAGLRKSHF